MGSQFLMSILKDSGIADIAISIVDYFGTVNILAHFA